MCKRMLACFSKTCCVCGPASLLLFASLTNTLGPFKNDVLYQTGEVNYACIGKAIEFTWRYECHENLTITWTRQTIDGGPWTTVGTLRTFESEYAVDFLVRDLHFSGRLRNSTCVALELSGVQKGDEGNYGVMVVDANATHTGKTKLAVYEDCPTAKDVNFTISCPTSSSSSSSSSAVHKRDQFEFEDTVNLAVSIPGSRPSLRRRLWYQFGQHEGFPQPIRPRCYRPGNCIAVDGDGGGRGGGFVGIVRWTLSKQSLTVAFYERQKTVDMQVIVELYYRRALWTRKTLPFRLMNPAFSASLKLHCSKNYRAAPSLLSLVLSSVVMATDARGERWRNFE